MRATQKRDSGKNDCVGNPLVRYFEVAATSGPPFFRGADLGAPGCRRGRAAMHVVAI
jgi:hypothetical protein